MTTIAAQLAALTTIRQLVEHHFPLAYYPGVEAQLQSAIELEPLQEITFDEERQTYMLKSSPVCRVCHATTDNLIDIPTLHGHFYICSRCQKDIVASGTLVTSLSSF